MVLTGTAHFSQGRVDKQSNPPGIKARLGHAELFSGSEVCSEASRQVELLSNSRIKEKLITGQEAPS